MDLKISHASRFITIAVIPRNLLLPRATPAFLPETHAAIYILGMVLYRAMAAAPAQLQRLTDSASLVEQAIAGG